MYSGCAGRHQHHAALGCSGVGGSGWMGVGGGGGVRRSERCCGGLVLFTLRIEC